ncbi:hypothetical protein FACS189487_08450 [Campylobacterota bacterium]|nr:hypothetical protein FACS189487_08450 [Campylobacterota bacterium]
MLLLATLFSLTACGNDFHNWGKERPTYTVSFDGNGAESNTPAPISGITSGNTISAPTAPVWKDNVFEDWYNGSTKWVFATSKVTSNITLIAKWKYTATEVWNIQDFSTTDNITEVTDTDDVISSSTLQLYLGSLAGGNYVVNLTKDHSFTGTSGIGVTLPTGVKVSLRGSQTITTNGSGLESMFNIPADTALILRGTTLQGRNDTTGTIEALVRINNGAFTMKTGSVIKDNNTNGGTANGNGGAVYVYNGTFTMEGGEIRDNNSTHYGGAVFVRGTFTMNGGTISNNNSIFGGAVLVLDGAFTMNSGTISGNNAIHNSGSDGDGGGVFVYSGTFTMNSGTISDNTARDDGGGVYVNNGGSFIWNSGTISDNNSTNGSGGGVYVGGSGSGGTFDMNGGTISGNRAISGAGGGVYAVNGAFTMNSGTISGNTANLYGGGVWVDNTNASFTKTSGGIIYGNDASTALANIVNSGNTKGHAVYMNTTVPSGSKYRDTTLGEGVGISTTDTSTNWE